MLALTGSNCICTYILVTHADGAGLPSFANMHEQESADQPEKVEKLQCELRLLAHPVAIWRSSVRKAEGKQTVKKRKVSARCS